MGRKERANFQRELEELHRVSKRDRDETDAYLAQNARTAAAEDQCKGWESFVVRARAALES